MITKLLSPQRNTVLVDKILLFYLKAPKYWGATKPVNLWQILQVFMLKIDEDTRVYDNLFPILCPQLDKFCPQFLRTTWAESHSAKNIHYRLVVETATLYLRLKSVRIHSALGGLPVILLQKKETPSAKWHTNFPLYCVMIWSVKIT